MDVGMDFFAAGVVMLMINMKVIPDALNVICPEKMKW